MQFTQNLKRGFNKIGGVIGEKVDTYKKEKRYENAANSIIKKKQRAAAYREREKQEVETAIYRERIKAQRQRQVMKSGNGGGGKLSGFMSYASNVSKNVNQSDMFGTKKKSKGGMNMSSFIRY